MESFKAKFPVLQELFAKNHRGGPFGPPPPAGRGLIAIVTYGVPIITATSHKQYGRIFKFYLTM